jgi:hypothetical protein
LEAAYYAGIERKFMSALKSAQDSVEHHRALLKTAPNFHDAELTIGLYNYVVGDLPLPVKMLVSPMGVKGSKKRGLEALERVAREGHWARDLALVLLVDLYKREKRWSDSIKVTRDLGVAVSAKLSVQAPACGRADTQKPEYLEFNRTRSSGGAEDLRVSDF